MTPPRAATQPTPPTRLSLLLIALLATAAAPTPTITDLRPIPLQPGVNPIDHLVPNGGPGLIVLAWRDNGNAWGYDTCTVLLQDHGRWQLAGIEHPAPKPGLDDDFALAASDSPHTGEDAITAIRFARAQLDGHPTTLLLEAIRTYPETPYDPAPTAYDVYALTPNTEGPGRTTAYFRRIQHQDLPAKYCHAEAALSQASGLPLRPSYGGKDTPTGC